MITVTWIAVVPDPVTGLDEPIEEAGTRRPKVWVAPNREYAVRLIRRDLLPNTFRLAAVVSVVDWESRKQTPQRPKLHDVAKPDPLGWHPHESNPRRICMRCGGPTGSGGNAKYCPDCRHPGPHKGKGRNQHSVIAK